MNCFGLRPSARGLYWYVINPTDRMTMSIDDKIITVESRSGAPLFVLQRILRMVPDRDKSDKRLQRLLAFRLLHDGEAATCEYLMRHIRRYVRQPAPRSFYDFLVQGRVPGASQEAGRGRDPEPPGAA
jgi:hypothetical protein